MSDDALQRWLAQIEAFERDDPRPLADREALLALALELGLGEETVTRAEADAEASLQRGRAFLAHGRPADAVDALSEAHSLAPWRFEILAGLAEAWTAAWEAAPTRAHRAEAVQAARSLIAVDPGYAPAYALLNRLDRTPARPAGRPPGPEGGHRVALALGGIAFAGLVGLISWVLLAVESPPAPPVAESPPPAALALASAAPAPLQAPEGQAAEGQAAEGQAPEGSHPLPITIEPGPALDGLEVEVLEAQIERARHGVRAKVRLAVQNRSQDLVRTLVGQLRFLDAAGRETGQAEVAVVNSARPQLRPGDRVFARPFASGRAGWETARAVLHFGEVERVPGAGPWPSATEACVEYPQGSPRPPPIAVRVRSQGQSGMFWRLEGEVEHVGSHPLTDLAFQARFLDAAGQQVLEGRSTDSVTLAAGWLPAFLPGERRLFLVSRIVPASQRANLAQACLLVTSLR